MITPDLIGHAQALVDANRYLTLSTISADGRPWTSPVCFAAAGVREFFSDLFAETQHSRNLGEHPQVSLVVFDSPSRRTTAAPCTRLDTPRTVRRRDGRRARRVPRTQPARSVPLDTRQRHRILRISPLSGNRHRPMGPVSARTPAAVPAAW